MQFILFKMVQTALRTFHINNDKMATTTNVLSCESAEV